MGMGNFGGGEKPGLKYSGQSFLALSLALCTSFATISPLAALAEGETSDAPAVSDATDKKTKKKSAKSHDKSSDKKSDKSNQKSSNKSSNKSSDKSSDNIGNSAIDKETMALINRGSWKAVSDLLGKQLAESKSKGKGGKSGFHGQLVDSYRQGWQAFAWMYQSQNDDLKKLVDGMPKDCFDPALAQSDDEKRMLGNALVMKCFDQIGQGKMSDAEATLKQAPDVCSGDALYNFALAAVSGKRGQAAKAVQYARVAVTIDPRFAWGYRTIGFLAQKLLKDNATAEDAYSNALRVEPKLDEARDNLVELKLAHNDFDGATDVAQDGIKVEPKNAASHFRLAQILTQQWRLRESLAELDQAIALDPKSAKYFRNRASVKRCQKDLDGAIADQTVAVDLSKDKGFELTELANLNLLAGNKNKAIENFKQALVLNSENEVARDKLFKLLVEEKRYTDLVDAYQDQIKRYPKSSELRMGYANVLLISGNRDKAIEQYKEAANLNQTDPAPHRALAAFYVQQNQFALAAKEFTRALNILPTSVKDIVALGFCYAETDDFMQAEAAFVTALALQQLSPNGMPDDPSRLDVMRSLAYLLYDEGRYGDASAQFDNIIAIYKDKGANKEDSFFLARCKLMRDLGAEPAKALLAAFKDLPADRQETLRYGMVESLLDSGQPDLARQALTDVPEAGRKTMAYGLYDGATWRLAGDNKKALEAVAPAVALAESAKNEDRAMASRVLCEKARIQMNLGDTDAAIVTVKAALTQYDKCYPASLLLAELSLKKGDTTAAIDASRRALDVNPYYAQAYVTTGEAMLATDKPKDAVENFKKAVELYPCWIDGHKALRNCYQKLSQAQDAQKEDATIAKLEGRIK